VVGKFQAATAEPTCTDCPNGKFQNAAGLQVCIGCATGKFGLDPTTSAVSLSSHCQECPQSKYQPVLNATACIQCLAGKFGDANIAVSNPLHCNTPPVLQDVACNTSVAGGSHGGGICLQNENSPALSTVLHVVANDTGTQYMSAPAQVNVEQTRTVDSVCQKGCCMRGERQVPARALTQWAAHPCQSKFVRSLLTGVWSTCRCWSTPLWPATTSATSTLTTAPAR
jgi:hypothetical protein